MHTRATTHYTRALFTYVCATNAHAVRYITCAGLITRYINGELHHCSILKNFELRILRTLNKLENRALELSETLWHVTQSETYVQTAPMSGEETGPVKV